MRGTLRPTQVALALLALGASTPAGVPGFEGRVEARMTLILEAFGEQPSLVERGERASLWVSKDGQRLGRGDPAHPSALSLQRFASAGVPHACRVIDRRCYGYHDLESGPSERWRVRRTGRDSVAGVACDVVRAETRTAKVDLCVTRELGPAGIWLKEVIPWAGALEQALSAADLGAFPLRAAVWQGRPQSEMEVVAITREPVPATSLDLPADTEVVP